MKTIKIMATVTAVALLATALSSCKASTEIKVPQQASFTTALDQTIPLLTGDNSEQLLLNIDRGFRTEMYYTLGSGVAWPIGGEDGYTYLNTMLARFTEENPREIQVYIYLNEYYNKPLDQKAFDQLKAYLEYLREKNLGVLLRFAYAPDQPYDKEPTQEQVLSHIAQLKAWMETNKTLINDTVTVLQMGIIGAWGEWGGSQQKYNRKKIALATCDMAPSGTYLQGRYMKVTSLTKKASNYDKVGYHNDFMVARPHPWNTAGDKNNSPAYRTFEKTALLRMNDGEMPWVSGTQEPNEYVNGKKFIQQCYEHHLATFSIEHNYKEVQKIAADVKDYNIARWKTEAITVADLKAMGCPYYESWFTNSDNLPIVRTVYEYLRDFLGYQLILSNLKTASVAGGSSISFLLSNVGLGAPLTLDRVELVLKNKTTGKQSRHPVNGFDPLKLTSYAQLSLSAIVKENLADYTVGIAISRYKSVGGNYAIRCANNVPYEDGVHLIIV